MIAAFSQGLVQGVNLGVQPGVPRAALHSAQGTPLGVVGRR